MSLWGATVITNLMSAIPWVGQDIVELNTDTVNYLHSALPTVGTLSHNTNKNINRRLNKQEYMVIPPSFIAFL